MVGGEAIIFRNLATIPNAGGCLSTRLLHNDPQALDRLRARAGAILGGAAFVSSPEN